MNRNDDKTLQRDLERLQELAYTVSVGYVGEALEVIGHWANEIEEQLEDIKEL